MGAKISKRYSSYKSQPKVLKLLLTFPPNGPHKIALGIFWNFEFPILNDFFFKNFKFTTVAYGEIKNFIIWKTSDHRAKQSVLWNHYFKTTCQEDIFLLGSGEIVVVVAAVWNKYWTVHDVMSVLSCQYRKCKKDDCRLILGATENIFQAQSIFMHYNIIYISDYILSQW